MENMFFKSVFTAMLICLAACQSSTSEHSDVEKVAEDFAKAYFNYDFEKAAQLATADSRKWLEYEASNLSHGDIDMLRCQDEGADAVVVGTDYNGGGWAMVSVTARNFLLADSIGGAGRIVDEHDFELKLRKGDDGQWKVRMEGPLRSGR